MNEVFQYENERRVTVKTALLQHVEHAKEQGFAFAVEQFHRFTNQEQGEALLEMAWNSSTASYYWDWTADASYQNGFVPKNPTQFARVYDQLSRGLVEIELTPFSSLVLKTFSKPTAYNEGFDRLCQDINVTDLPKLQRQFFECVTYLLTNGLLFVHPKTVL